MIEETLGAPLQGLRSENNQFLPRVKRDDFILQAENTTDLNSISTDDMDCQSVNNVNLACAVIGAQ
jgi:hypothetical protein